MAWSSLGALHSVLGVLPLMIVDDVGVSGNPYSTMAAVVLDQLVVSGQMWRRKHKGVAIQGASSSIRLLQLLLLRNRPQIPYNAFLV